MHKLRPCPAAWQSTRARASRKLLDFRCVLIVLWDLPWGSYWTATPAFQHIRLACLSLDFPWIPLDFCECLMPQAFSMHSYRCDKLCYSTLTLTSITLTKTAFWGTLTTSHDSKTDGTQKEHEKAAWHDTQFASKSESQSFLLQSIIGHVDN